MVARFVRCRFFPTVRRDDSSWGASGFLNHHCKGLQRIFGALDVPLVYFSIWIFRTQHPQPVIGGGGSIDPRMLHVLLLNWLAFSCFAFLVCWSRYRLERATREIEETLALEALLEPRNALR